MSASYQFDATNKYIWIGSVSCSVFVLILILLSVRFWLIRSNKRNSCSGCINQDRSLMINSLHRYSYMNTNPGCIERGDETARFSSFIDYATTEITPLPKAHAEPSISSR
ncbi:hypothetical protein CONCODRAFT_9316 [Conidiobolus coronatus NRRL 28638]|uniref:Uncharacterized protein n=1 Tax=Conidiobolus coronatus (strain ATCC 28846 / CBS 209.66 / NRRL 28638) TaxID=796925 RepID=A0A137P070_CONC2|nr:hypothetical protein CONCODRAFT_9316 [Conidiobolus coronatus NRRL 28638]|eukprot:KXN68427.1 hypothetical protein CONCODRAFT_9316 [Conidiobolus coronatus NRRL 28638]